jgi:hypothetical protein
MKDQLGFDNVEPFYILPTALRVIAALLLHSAVFKKFQKILRMLSFLKRGETSKTDKRGRVVNLFLCLLWLAGPILALLAMCVTMVQEKKLSMITKNYMVIAMLLNVDKQFSSLLPKTLKQNAAKQTGLKMGKDHNKFKNIFGRLLKHSKVGDIGVEMFNLLVNMVVSFTINFQVICYNYFAPVIVLLI